MAKTNDALEKQTPYWKPPNLEKASMKYLSKISLLYFSDKT